jgi:hypothetical protein
MGECSAAGTGFCRGLVFLRQRKVPIAIAVSRPIIAAATAIPAIVPVDRECVFEVDERDWDALPAIEEEVEVAPEDVGKVPC